MILDPLSSTSDADGPDGEAAPDGTLGGYLSHHKRPPAFEGINGHPYTVSLEVEKTPNLETPFSGFLVFLQWAYTGVGIVGHLETPLFLHGKSREEVIAELEALSLKEVNDLLRDAILRRQQETE